MQSSKQFEATSANLPFPDQWFELRISFMPSLWCVFQPFELATRLLGEGRMTLFGGLLKNGRQVDVLLCILCCHEPSDDMGS